MTIAYTQKHNYNIMKYFGYLGIKDALQHSFQWRLITAIWGQLLMLLTILIGIGYIGVKETNLLIETWVFRPSSFLWILSITITADWLSGALRGFKSREGFVTRKATQIGAKIFFNWIFFAILFNVSQHMIKPLVPEAVNLNIILISVVLVLAFTHLVSLAKNLSAIGLMPKVFVEWFEKKVDKYKDNIDKIV